MDAFAYAKPHPDFSPDLNAAGAAARFDPLSNIAKNIFGGAVASVVDFGASVWNSLPMTPEVSTSEILGKISNDALQVYEENPDTIHSISFIGGMFVPAGLAMKGMKMLRSGSKSVNWFTDAGKAEDLAKATKIFEEAGKGTTAYRDAMRSLYIKGAANQALDAVAAEAAIVFTLSAHPLMEDYMADPIKSFAISAAGGSVLGAGIGHIADRFMIKSQMSEVFQKAFDTARADVKMIEPGMTGAVAIQTLEQNKQNLTKFLDNAADQGMSVSNNLSVRIADSMRTEAANQQIKLFDSMVDESLKKLPAADKMEIMRTVSQQFEMHGVNEVSLVNPSSAISRKMIEADFYSITGQKPILTRQVLHKDGTISLTEKEAIYFPNLNAYGPMGSQIHYGNVNILFNNIEEAAKVIPATAYKNVNFDSTIELMGTSAATAQATVIGKLGKFAEISDKHLPDAMFADSDTAGLTAILNRMRVSTDPNIKVKMVDKSVFYQSQLAQKIVQQGPLTKKYTDASEQMFTPAALRQKNYINLREDSSASAKVHQALTRWVAGDQWQIQKGSVAYFARGYSAAGMRMDKDVQDARRLFEDIYESEASKRAREKFRQISDNGYVYLYRGTKTSTLKGTAPVESMGISYEKAREFAKSQDGVVNLYKIDVDDIIAVIDDFGSAANQTEILVRSSAREAKVSIDSTTQTVKNATPTSSTVISRPNNVRQVGTAEIERAIRNSKAEELNTLLANAIPMESIALRTNTPQWLVEAYAADGSAGPQVIERILAQAKANGRTDVDLATGNAIYNLDTAKKAFGATQTPLLLRGDLKKNPYIEAHAGLDNKAIRDINKTWVEAALNSTNAPIVRSWADFMNTNRAMFDLMETQLSKVNAEAAGNRFFNSVDFWARNMGDLGPIVSAIGKQVQALSNEMIGRVADPIRNTMNAISKDPAAIIEFTTFVQINAGLKGWRTFEYETGRILQRGEDALGKTTLEPVMHNGQPYVVSTPAVRESIATMQAQGKELRDLHNVSRKIKGQQNVNDIGLWIPSLNPVNKYIAYLHDLQTDSVKMIVANTKEAYNDAVRLERENILSQGLGKTMRVVERGQDKELWSRLNGRMDPFTMERANVGEQKTGSSALANIKADLSIFGEIIGGYEHYITSQMRQLADLSMSDVTYTLDRLSTLHTWGTDSQPLTKVKQIVDKAKDPAATMRNVLTGSTSLDEYTGWRDANRSFETILSYGVNTVNKVFESAIKPLSKTFFGKEKTVSLDEMKKLDYQKIAQELEQRGIVNPWEGYDQAMAAEKYAVSKLEDSPDISKRIVYAGNALAATVALRIGELAQPLVNVMSLPILTHLAAANKMPETFLGIAKGTAKVTPVQIMYEGARAANSPVFKHLDEQWMKAGYYEAAVSEVNQTLMQSRSLDKGAIAATERMLDSSIVKMLSRVSDWSESFVRRQTMFTGAVLAKRLYPELDDAGVTLFARDFMDKAVGNFHAPQRPVFFQGTMGVALGLFQTYALTFGQSMYRHLELKNYRELGKAALLQSTIFGTSSLPGFTAVSHLIGEHFSDDHVDFETGAFRALSDPLAESVIYGLPSQLGIGTHTRGDANFRIPGMSTDGIVALNFAKQAVQSVMHVADAVGNADKSVPQAFAEALSLQSMSRPLARGAELAMGQSITQKGNTVSTPEEVWTLSGIAARVLGTRPIEEIKLRNAIHLNSFYGAIDYENRQSLMMDLKTRIRGGVLTDEDVSKASLRYMENGGTPAGWRAAIAKTLATTETDGKEELANKLRPNSPLYYMVNSLDGY